MKKWILSITAVFFCCSLGSPGYGSDLLEELLGIKLFEAPQIEEGEEGYGLFIKRRQSDIRPLFDFGLGIFPPPAKDQSPAAVVVRVKGSSRTTEQLLGYDLTEEIARFSDETEELFFRVITGITGQHTFYPPKDSSKSAPSPAETPGQPALARPAGAVRTIGDGPLYPSPPAPETDPTAFLPETTKKR